ncbi:mitochondrial 37S ribosomal protein mS37 [Trichoderma atroviride]|uniref:mitochondrial 37S ribosomal protein mS37 n=1 Tax=Hypocrea atroviridis TaxID=63577 RepID=UPI0033222C69|nr:hypothetical protein TrAtP1_010456 [Trichoderma atroviride]
MSGSAKAIRLPPAEDAAGAQSQAPARESLHRHHVQRSRVLGFSRLQRRRLRRHREPAPEMHGRPSASSRAGEYHQLPLVADAEIRNQPEEAEINDDENEMMYKRQKEGRIYIAIFE